MQRMREEKRMVEKDVEEGGSEIPEVEASGDTIVIAGAIHDLADSIRHLARSMSEGGEPEPEVRRYLDGTAV